MQLINFMNINDPLRIMVVDDRDTVRESLRIVLTLEDDIEVVGEAEDGRQAVNVARVLNPDIVLMDCEMPGNIDGIEACREIKEANLARAVIILTMHGNQQVRRRAFIAGCDLFLEKGINTTELLDQVRRVAGR
ncbi:MAG: response regulator transcription factor [Chloroflexota bacterium]|nr:response regulator transcription factor [Chloroflexota bacterium]